LICLPIEPIAKEKCLKTWGLETKVKLLVRKDFFDDFPEGRCYYYGPTFFIDWGTEDKKNANQKRHMTLLPKGGGH